MNHSPTPWIAVKNRVSMGGPLPPTIEAGGVVIAVLEGQEQLYTADGNDRDCNAEAALDDANADHIVLAINAHNDLVAACEHTLVLLDEMHGHWPSTMSIAAASVRKTLTAALAKANGGA